MVFLPFIVLSVLSSALRNFVKALSWLLSIRFHICFFVFMGAVISAPLSSTTSFAACISCSAMNSMFALGIRCSMSCILVSSMPSAARKPCFLASISASVIPRALALATISSFSCTDFLSSLFAACSIASGNSTPLSCSIFTFIARDKSLFIVLTPVSAFVIT